MSQIGCNCGNIIIKLSHSKRSPSYDMAAAQATLQIPSVVPNQTEDTQNNHSDHQIPIESESNTSGKEISNAKPKTLKASGRSIFISKIQRVSATFSSGNYDLICKDCGCRFRLKFQGNTILFKQLSNLPENSQFKTSKLSLATNFPLELRKFIIYQNVPFESIAPLHNPRPRMVTFEEDDDPIPANFNSRPLVGSFSYSALCDFGNHPDQDIF